MQKEYFWKQNMQIASKAIALVLLWLKQLDARLISISELSHLITFGNLLILIDFITGTLHKQITTFENLCRILVYVCDLLKQ